MIYLAARLSSRANIHAVLMKTDIQDMHAAGVRLRAINDATPRGSPDRMKHAGTRLTRACASRRISTFIAQHGGR